MNFPDIKLLFSIQHPLIFVPKRNILVQVQLIVWRHTRQQATSWIVVVFRIAVHWKNSNVIIFNLCTKFSTACESFYCSYFMGYQEPTNDFEHACNFIGIHLGWINIPDSKVHGTNMGPTWVLSVPGRPHVGLMNLAIWDTNDFILWRTYQQLWLQLIFDMACHPGRPITGTTIVVSDLFVAVNHLNIVAKQRVHLRMPDLKLVPWA